MSKVSLEKTDRDKLGDIIANQADQNARAFGTAQRYLEDLIDRTNWPGAWKRKRRYALGTYPPRDALALIDWALNQGTIPEGEGQGYTTLGSLLEVLMPDVGQEDRLYLAAVIATYQLYRPVASPPTLGVHSPEAKGTTAQLRVLGPDFEWKGPDNELELQAYLKPEPELVDVGAAIRFWTHAYEQAASVCRIEFENIPGRQGTGFLIAKGLVLTNYHVLANPDDAKDDADANARHLTLCFGKISMTGGQAASEQRYKLSADQPIAAQSSVEDLDFALLRTEERLWEEEGIRPLRRSLTVPGEKSAIHLLGYPVGEDLQLARSMSGVTWVDEKHGKIQYWTRGEPGMSGSPGFDDDWNVVAVHHAEKEVFAGTRREGILIASIYQQVKEIVG